MFSRLFLFYKFDLRQNMNEIWIGLYYIAQNMLVLRISERVDSIQSV